MFYQRQLALWKRDPETLKLSEEWGEALDDAGEPAPLPEGYAAELLAGEGVVTDLDNVLRLRELLAQRLWRALLRQQQIDGGDYSPNPLPSTFPA